MSAGFPVSPGAAIAGALHDAGYALRLRGYSALDSYLGVKKPLPFVQAETDADIAVLARLFEGLRFPGVDLADAALETPVPQANTADGKPPMGYGQTWYFRCGEPGEPPSYALLSFTQDWRTRRFYDPAGLYPLLRALKGKPLKAEGEGLLSWPVGLDPQAGYYRALMDGALILARYGEGPPGTCADISAADISAGPVMRPLLQALQTAPKDPSPCLEAQRLLLTGLLVSPRPDWGLEFLKAAGFVDAFWPEIARLDQADHAKEYHPEGNAWNHTLETFRYRKRPGDLVLSLALLFHDAGKPLAVSSGAKRFNGHAELGARTARRFLEALEFPPEIAAQVFFLVRNHMLPAALPRLPLSRTAEVLESPLFPTLLELYRCDESSSFKGLEGYYRSSAAYRAYLRQR